MSNLKFLDACLQGEALIEEIDDYIEQWHMSEVDEELDQFLGFSEDEYELWLHNDNSVINSILFARKNKMPLRHYDTLTAVARSASKGDAERIISWLKDTGRME